MPTVGGSGMALPFEAHLQVAHNTEEAMADVVAYAWNNAHAQNNDEDSGSEEGSWARTGRHRTRAADAIDRGERDRRNNESPPPRNHDYEVRRRGRDFEAALASRFEGTASANDVFVFRRTFNRFLNLPLPVGTGWESRAGILEGMRIMNQEYGPSNVALLDTTLDPTMPTFSGTPSQLCHSRREQLRRRDERRGLVYRLGSSLLRRRTNMLQQNLDDRMTAYVNATENDLRQYQLSGDGIIDEFTRRIAIFRTDNPTTFSAWAEHLTIAEHATTSPSRRFQIAQWFTRDVPGKVARQLRRVEIFHTNVGILKERLRIAQVEVGEIEDEPNREIRLRTDELWQSDPQRYDFGWEITETTNGFSDYIPRGKDASVEVAKHILANFEVRKVRLAHAKAMEASTLNKRMRKFIGRALSWIYSMSNPDTPREIQVCMRRVANRLVAYSNSLPEDTSEEIVGEQGDAAAADDLSTSSDEHSSELAEETATRRNFPDDQDSESDEEESELDDDVE